MKIINLSDDISIVQQTAEVLLAGFQATGTRSWENVEDAVEEVRESLADGCISRIAVSEEGKVLGWIGGIEEYKGFVWELHPLVVHPDFQNQGIGRALVVDFEQQVKLRGGTTIMLGTDDEDNRTSLGGVDLYPNILKNLSEIKNLRAHPFGFYQKLGYVITGIIPDANGFGKPDILMCKRV